jgi:hypothetical protein
VENCSCSKKPSADIYGYNYVKTSVPMRDMVILEEEGQAGISGVQKEMSNG